MPRRAADDEGRRRRDRRRFGATLLAIAVLAALLLLLTVTAGPPPSPPLKPGQGRSTRPEPPRHVLATQGPTDPDHLRVVVTWDRRDPTAVAYRILRDGREVARVPQSGERWDDEVWRDPRVSGGATYAYQVRAEDRGGILGRASRPYRVRVRSDRQIGSGRVYQVDGFGGTDSERAEAAVAAARRAGGGVVLFGPRTYRLDRSLLVSAADNVVLRGAGSDRTTLMPAFAGATDPCGIPAPLVIFRGRRAALPTRLRATARAGSRQVAVAGTDGLRIGQPVIFDQAPPERTPGTFRELHVREDPVLGGDRRGPFEINEIAGLSHRRVTLRYPLAYDLLRGAKWQAIERGVGDGIERLTLQGRGPAESTYYHLLDIDDVAGMQVADVRGRWANRSFAEVRGYDVNFVGVSVPQGGPLSFDTAPCKYRISIVRSSNVLVVDTTMGEAGDDDNQSFVTVQRAPRVVVRSSRFYGSRTYALNEHGGGSQDLIFENNRIAVGPRAKFGGVLLGNSTWGFSGPAIVRNNLFVGNSRDLVLQENSYGTRFVDNVSRGNVHAVVDGYGWAGPDTPAQRRGSLRLTVRDNRVEDARGDGVVLGAPASPWFPYPGVRDVVVADNVLGVRGIAVRLAGSAASTNRFSVVGNRGSARYRRPALRGGDAWAANADRVRFGRRASAPAWSADGFTWERYDTGGR